MMVEMRKQLNLKIDLINKKDNNKQLQKVQQKGFNVFPAIIKFTSDN